MTVVNRLHAEHHGVLTALMTFESQIERLIQDGTADFELMRDALEFTTAHPHPAGEAFLCQRVAERARNGEPLIAHLVTDHVALRQAAEELMEDVEDMADDVLVAKDVFVARARDFLDRERHRVAVEENELLPLAEKALNMTDWREIERLLPDGSDRVSGEVGELLRWAH